MKIPVLKQKTVAILLITAVAIAGVGYALFSLQQVIQITTQSAPFSGAGSLSISNVSPCSTTGACNGVLVTGASGAAAITFTTSSTPISSVWTSSDVTKPQEVFIVPTTVTACGTTIPTGGIQVAPGTVTPMSPQPLGAYDYCLYYPTLPPGATLTVTVNYSA